MTSYRAAQVEPAEHIRGLALESFRREMHRDPADLAELEAYAEVKRCNRDLPPEKLALEVR